MHASGALLVSNTHASMYALKESILHRAILKKAFSLRHGKTTAKWIARPCLCYERPLSIDSKGASLAFMHNEEHPQQQALLTTQGRAKAGGRARAHACGARNDEQS